MTNVGTPQDQGRVIYAALHLLDHQMIDRDGARCGNVDDIELADQGDGTLLVTHLLAGPGVLAVRMGAHRLGQWWRHATNAETTIAIPMRDVAEIGSDIRLGAAAADLATANTERWARERIIEHIPDHGVRGEPDAD
jgi:hypothetical protein